MRTHDKRIQPSSHNAALASHSDPFYTYPVLIHPFPVRVYMILWYSALNVDSEMFEAGSALANLDLACNDLGIDAGRVSVTPVIL